MNGKRGFAITAGPVYFFITNNNSKTIQSNGKKKITNNNQTYAYMNQKTNSNLCMNLKCNHTSFACRKWGVSEGKKKKYRKKLGGQKIIAYLCNRIYIKV